MTPSMSFDRTTCLDPSEAETQVLASPQAGPTGKSEGAGFARNKSVRWI